MRTNYLVLQAAYNEGSREPIKKTNFFAHLFVGSIV